MTPGGLQGNEPTGLGGWLWVYVVGSVPLLMTYSMGLAGWFFDYPIGLVVAIFVLLAAPLSLIVIRSPRAPRWNIAQLWIIVVLMSLRSVSVLLVPGNGVEVGDGVAAEVALILAGIVSVTVAWALLWTTYFLTSVRVRNTFS